jgi:hypothetical protein
MNRLRKNLILAGGIIMVALGLFHTTFWLNPMWSSELAKLHPEMSALVQLFNICNVTLLTALGVALLVCRREVATTRLGRALLLVIALFLAVRTVAGGFFPTDGNLLITGVLTLCVLLYLIPAVMKEER